MQFVKTIGLCVVAALFFTACSRPSTVVNLAGEQLVDWPCWRGPANGVAAEAQSPPTKFSLEENVVWKSRIPGRGHSSPIVSEGKIFITTAETDSETQSVLGYSQGTGELLWQTKVNKGEFNPTIHPSNTHASPSVATANQRVFAVFNNHSASQLVCLDFDGKILWEKQAGKFVPKQYQFGYGASPIVIGNIVIVSSESENDGFLAAFDQVTGAEVWRTKRLGATSYSTPAIFEIDGKLQLVISGGKNVTGYDPKDGKQLWQVEGPWLVTCGTPVCEGNIVVVSGGFPTARTMAIEINGTEAKIIWQNAHICYEQSLLAHEGYIYALTDNGLAICLKTKDGTEQWNERLSRPVSASPVVANGNVYFADERGGHFVIAADPQAFKVVEKNRLGDVSYASPAIIDSRIYTRVGVKEAGSVQEWLVCLGQ